MKRIKQVRAAALIVVPSLVLLAVVSAAATAQAAPVDGGIRVNFWQGISVTDGDGEGDF
ncbi:MULTISPECIES: hypothetical protein [Streptomyces]|uniref:Uncharacterized protein n=1 Tax=Streptomyces achmelvichensis TaxID=3134111 RepID=A0ACC6PLJ6_9ACTN|nr:hypothetical protein [Streptomyces sp. NBC_00306]